MSAVEMLLASTEPAVRVLARRDLLGEPADGPADDPVLGGARVQALLAGQQPDGGFGGDPYKKWTGAHWRLVSLVELGLPPGEPRAVAAAGRVLDWLAEPRRLAAVPVVHGLARRCASQEGNAVAVCSRLGLAGDQRVRTLVHGLLGWQWPDGGWNCDGRASGRRSSFHETLAAVWGLAEYARATGDEAAAAAAERGAELFLEHRIVFSVTTGQVVDRQWLRPRWPPYWHYDLLQALLVLSRVGRGGDPRAEEALARLAQRRESDGTWRARGRWWRPPGSTKGGPVEALDWGRGEDEMVTLNALRVLRAAGRPVD